MINYLITISSWASSKPAHCFADTRRTKWVLGTLWDGPQSKKAHTAIWVATTTDSSWLGVRVRLRVIVLRLSSWTEEFVSKPLFPQFFCHSTEATRGKKVLTSSKAEPAAPSLLLLPLSRTFLIVSFIDPYRCSASGKDAQWVLGVPRTVALTWIPEDISLWEFSEKMEGSKEAEQEGVEDRVDEPFSVLGWGSYRTDWGPSGVVIA